jgi:pimeloyl-ACP methyl ester carboxylesterase
MTFAKVIMTLACLFSCTLVAQEAKVTQLMQAGLKNAYDSIKAFSETDFTEDLKKFDVPALVMHGEDD